KREQWQLQNDACVSPAEEPADKRHAKQVKLSLSGDQRVERLRRTNDRQRNQLRRAALRHFGGCRLQAMHKSSSDDKQRQQKSHRARDPHQNARSQLVIESRDSADSWTVRVMGIQGARGEGKQRRKERVLNVGQQ